MPFGTLSKFEIQNLNKFSCFLEVSFSHLGCKVTLLVDAQPLETPESEEISLGTSLDASQVDSLFPDASPSKLTRNCQTFQMNSPMKFQCPSITLMPGHPMRTQWMSKTWTPSGLRVDLQMDSNGHPVDLTVNFTFF